MAKKFHINPLLALVMSAALQDTVISFPSERAEQGQIGRYFMALDTLITLHQRERENTDFGRKET